MKKVLLAGCGGWGEQWVKYTLPRCERDGLIQVVGAMDTRLENAARAQMMVFAALESGRRGVPVNPGRLMEEYRKKFS